MACPLPSQHGNFLNDVCTKSCVKVWLLSRRGAGGPAVRARKHQKAFSAEGSAYERVPKSALQESGSHVDDFIAGEASHCPHSSLVTSHLRRRHITSPARPKPSEVLAAWEAC